MADAASGDGEPSEKIRETADARFGSFVSRNERVEKGDGRKTICQIITNTYLGHFYANILMFKVPLLFNLDQYRNKYRIGDLLPRYYRTVTF